MDLAQMLRELWRRKLWLALGFVVAAVAGLTSAYNVDIRSLEAEKKGLEFGAASTEILIDMKSSALPKVGSDAEAEPLEFLANRADVYGRLLTSAPLKRQIAREAGLGNIKIAARPPVDLTEDEAKQPSEERANELLNESNGHRLFFDRKEGIPVISTYVEAPTEKEALLLATGVVPALSKYVRKLQRRNPAPANREVSVRQLGEPTGGIVNDGAGTTVALLSFFGVFVVACIIILIVSTVSREWRRGTAFEHGELVSRGAPGPVTSVPANGNHFPAEPQGGRPEGAHGSTEVSWIRRIHSG
jgi:hypothetical protein